jgi:hypothetical protein
LPDTAKEEDKGDKQERAEETKLHSLFMPVTYMSRRDADEWIVEGQATAEVPDSFGTIFTYEASKKAFSNWIKKYANVREMHNKVAAGRGLEVNFDDANKRVLVRTRVSKAEPGIWLKWHEGTLNGLSVGAGSNYKMGRMTYQGKSYPAITEYELAELSYVDAPSCPGSDGYVVSRAMEGQEFILSDIIDDSDPEQSTEATTQEAIQAVDTAELERAGARLSADSREKLHSMRDQAMALCGCDECQGMSSNNDDDDDGDDDGVEERMQAILERSNNPIFQRHNAILARYAQFDTNYAEIKQQLDELKSIKEQLAQLGEIKAVLERVTTASTLEEVRAEMSAMETRVKKIEDSPAPGGPVLNGARNPYDKTNPYQSPQHSSGLDRAQIEQETLERLSAKGAFKTVEEQTAAAALLLKPFRVM